VSRVPRASGVAGVLLLLLLALPVLGLVAETRPADVLAALTAPATRVALGLSLGTTLAALTLALLLGTPLAWALSRTSRPVRGAALTLVELPVVLPPAVLGVALLETFGRAGWLGPALAAVGVHLPFTTGAVVLAQLLVGAPLYVLAATAAFRAVDDDLLLVARTLGASPARATLLFAGSLPGRTRTLPLAIYAALEQDMGQARAISVLLVGVAAALLLGLRLVGARVPRAR
jgi:molybdate transport system permease protein